MAENKVPETKNLPSTALSTVTSYLTLDNRNGAQFDALLGDSRRVAGVHYLRDVFVRLRSFFHDQLRRGDADGDALGCKLVQHLR